DTTLSAPVTLRTSNRDSDKLITEINHNNKNATDTTLALFSKSEQETKEIAGRLLLKQWEDITTTGLVIALDGDLGVGKTIFTKGSAEFLKIEDIIKSPTYTYIEEYDFTRHQTSGKLFHLDMWKVADKTMFERLEIENLFGQNTVVIIEWFSEVADYIQPLLQLKEMPLLKIKISEVGSDPETRKLEITDYSFRNK
ncbi:tRNA (adenosine(37)-N6)-threonylcarbamoyltransferase complex ATPase subunit type 1 TsaE, partial [Candidatus Woesebacteria bacterium]|nr:tRNA (adenosine(37)-N6)-threonylcarbamoyltransferase complex ATPase subunit type 1 TsaE [Candidatus Woesebacteria bacterium]